VGIVVGVFQSLVVNIPVPLALVAGLALGWIVGYLVCITCPPFRKEIRRVI
jgi:predicted ABC-type sugar transport system permease subunit